MKLDASGQKATGAKSSVKAKVSSKMLDENFEKRRRTCEYITKPLGREKTHGIERFVIIVRARNRIESRLSEFELNFAPRPIATRDG